MEQRVTSISKLRMVENRGPRGVSTFVGRSGPELGQIKKSLQFNEYRHGLTCLYYVFIENPSVTQGRYMWLSGSSCLLLTPCIFRLQPQLRLIFEACSTTELPYLKILDVNHNANLAIRDIERGRVIY